MIGFKLEWNEKEVTRLVILSYAKDLKSRDPSVTAFPQDDNPPKWLTSVLHRLNLHLSGTPQSFTDVPLNWEGIPPFHLRVYKALQGVPAGNTVSYGELARMAGSPGAARAVGQAMAKNPYPILVPCHRVVAANGRLGGFSGGCGVLTKRELLGLEGYENCTSPSPGPVGHPPPEGEGVWK